MANLKKEKKKGGSGHIRERSWAAEVLLAIAEDLADANVLARHPGMVMKYGLDGPRFLRSVRGRQENKRAMERLRERDMIRVDQKASQYQITLTEKGVYELSRLKVLRSSLHEDQKVCMVVFDIPENKRKLRSELRRFLSSAAFIPLQRSVWISPFDAAEALADVFRSVKADRWVQVYTAQRHD